MDDDATLRVMLLVILIGFMALLACSYVSKLRVSADTRQETLLRKQRKSRSAGGRGLTFTELIAEEPVYTVISGVEIVLFWIINQIIDLFFVILFRLFNIRDDMKIGRQEYRISLASFFAVAAGSLFYALFKNGKAYFPIYLCFMLSWMIPLLILYYIPFVKCYRHGAPEAAESGVAGETEDQGGEGSTADEAVSGESEDGEPGEAEERETATDTRWEEGHQ